MTDPITVDVTGELTEWPAGSWHTDSLGGWRQVHRAWRHPEQQDMVRVHLGPVQGTDERPPRENPYGDYLAPGLIRTPPVPPIIDAPHGMRHRAEPQRHWLHLDDDGRLDAADCSELGGHCWRPAGQVILGPEPQYPQACIHCSATRVGVKRDPMAWTYPAGQP